MVTAAGGGGTNTRSRIVWVVAEHNSHTVVRPDDYGADCLHN